MPVQSVELLLDPETDRRVRAVWQALADAGLPSQARHLAPSNRPHITLVATDTLAADADVLLPEQVRELPVAGTWIDVVEFGNGPWTVVRLIEPSAGMRALQARVAGVCGVPPDSLTTPERWTPHVTLARRVDADVLARVRAVVAEATRHESDRDGGRVLATGVRRWDGGARREWPVCQA